MRTRAGGFLRSAVLSLIGLAPLLISVLTFELHSQPESHADVQLALLWRVNTLPHRRRYRLFRCISTLVRNVTAKRVHERTPVVGKNLCIPLAARNCDVGHAVVEQVLGGEIGIHMDEYAISGLALARVASNSIAMVQMGILRRIEDRFLPAVQLDLHLAIRSDFLNRPQLTVRDLQLVAGRSELDTVAQRERLLLFPINGHAHLPARIVGSFATVCARDRQQILLRLNAHNTRILSLAYA